MSKDNKKKKVKVNLTPDTLTTDITSEVIPIIKKDDDDNIKKF
ncbi:MAG: hypothetical protein PHO01_07350 [Desulfotomaculaceae bacterium]|nr:hypothetical protein [Desulfotomaculaceae bacterium]